MKRFFVILICTVWVNSICQAQCEEGFSFTYSKTNELTCQLNFNFDINFLEEYSSVTAFVRVCDTTYQSETFESTGFNQDVQLNFNSSVDCNDCPVYEPFLIFTSIQDNDEVISTQCSVEPFTTSFDNCPEIEVVDESFLILNDQECGYIQQLSVKSFFDLDQLELNILDCESFNNIVTLEDLRADESYVVQYEISNTCGCDELIIIPKMIKDDLEVLCDKLSIPIRRIEFLPFPLELEKFDLIERDNMLFAEWNTLFEIAISEFRIEYSSDLINFEELITVVANQEQSEYSAELPNREGYYRMRTFNFDNQFAFTDVFFHRPNIEFSFFNNQFILPQAKQLEIYNISGQLISSQHTRLFDMTTLPSNNIYLIVIDGQFIQKYYR